ncbi:hypothetical protein [Persephonella sp.]|uniref:hypothetical protein n=1 Tax=Persephonella sp. TaxID=2060922 RepID=UPI00261EAAFD|nr:hypothetical protein [Persephonella sp.]
MKIAVVSFDSELVAKVAAELSGAEVKGYMDSLSLVNELKEGRAENPDIVIYDASGGEIALNALEFFISRPQVKGIDIRALIEKGSVNDESLKKFEGIKFYDKETELGTLIEELKSKTPKEPFTKPETEQTTPVQEKQPEITEEKEESYVPPQDLEALLGETVSASEDTGEEFELELEEEVSDMDSLLEELTPQGETEETSPLEAAVPSIEEAITGNGNKAPEEAIVSSNQPKASNVNQNNIKMTIELSPEEVKKIVLETAVEKFIDEIRSELDLDKIKEEIQKDFFDRLEKEMTQSIDQMKEEIKAKLFESIEADLKEKIKESIKEDVARITTELVKEKLNQAFGGGK